MRKGEHYIVTSEEGSRHPVGTEVVVIDMVNPNLTDKPYYCKAVQGNTCYWYGKSGLQKVEEWQYENKS